MKKAKDTAVELSRIQQLEIENAELRAKLKTPKIFSVVEDEIRQINIKGRDTSGTIKVVETTDHKNISLWTRDGQRIGPLHPENAKKALLEFRSRGILLSATRPTIEEVEAYQQTDEYKDEIKAIAKERAIKDKSRRSGSMDKLISLMEKQYGLDKSQLVNVLSPEQVKSR